MSRGSAPLAAAMLVACLPFGLLAQPAADLDGRDAQRSQERRAADDRRAAEAPRSCSDARVAEPPPIRIDWPTLPGRPPAAPHGPVEPAATGRDAPAGDPARRERDDDRTIRERDQAARERTRSALDEQNRRIRDAITPPPAGAPAAPLQNCGPGGCFDSQGRLLPWAGPALITPSGRPCTPNAAGSGC
jgi:hypothetical protein